MSKSDNTLRFNCRSLVPKSSVTSNVDRRVISPNVVETDPKYENDTPITLLNLENRWRDRRRAKLEDSLQRRRHSECRSSTLPDQETIVPREPRLKATRVETFQLGSHSSCSNDKGNRSVRFEDETLDRSQIAPFSKASQLNITQLAGLGDEPNSQKLNQLAGLAQKKRTDSDSQKLITQSRSSKSIRQNPDTQDVTLEEPSKQMRQSLDRVADATFNRHTPNPIHAHNIPPGTYTLSKSTIIVYGQAVVDATSDTRTLTLLQGDLCVHISSNGTCCSIQRRGSESSKRDPRRTLYVEDCRRWTMEDSRMWTLVSRVVCRLQAKTDQVSGITASSQSSIHNTRTCRTLFHILVIQIFRLISARRYSTWPVDDYISPARPHPT